MSNIAFKCICSMNKNNGLFVRYVICYSVNIHQYLCKCNWHVNVTNIFAYLEYSWVFVFQISLSRYWVIIILRIIHDCTYIVKILPYILRTFQYCTKKIFTNEVIHCLFLYLCQRMYIMHFLQIKTILGEIIWMSSKLS